MIGVGAETRGADDAMDTVTGAGATTIAAAGAAAWRAATVARAAAASSLSDFTMPPIVASHMRPQGMRKYDALEIAP